METPHCITEVGTGQNLIASTLASSTWMPSQETTYPRKTTLGTKNSQLSSFQYSF